MTAMEVASITVGGGGAAIILRDLFNWLRGRNTDQNAHDRQSRQDTRDEFQELYERQQKDYERQQAEIEELVKREDRYREELSVLWRRFERMSAWMVYLESVLKQHDIKFVSHAEHSSEEHPKLITDGKP